MSGSPPAIAERVLAGVGLLEEAVSQVPLNAAERRAGMRCFFGEYEAAIALASGDRATATFCVPRHGGREIQVMA